jgi:dipeptidyl aminopeptidase/acylaminoacyl peptidase
MKRSGAWSCVVVAALGMALPGAAQKRRIELADFAKTVTVSEPQISPDGKTIAFVVTRINLEKDRRDRSLELLDIATGAARPLTYERERVSTPRWSPTGDRLAFLAADGKGEKAKEQVFVLPMSGGEAQQITAAPEGVEQFAWRPDGKEIACVTSDEPPNKEEIKKHLDAFEVGDNDYLATAAATPSHIWLVSAESGMARRLSSGAWSLPKAAPPGPPLQGLCWSPDGRSLAFVRQATPNQGDADRTVIEILNVETGKSRKLTAHDKFEGMPVYSPDGNEIAYWYPRDGDLNNENEIELAAASGGASRDLTGGLDRDILRQIWMPGGHALLVGGHDGTRTALWLLPLDGPARRINLGEINPAWSFWVDVTVGPRGEIALAGNTPADPSELYYLASPEAPPKQLTHFNQWTASLDLGRTETFSWQGPNGFEDDGVVTTPPEFAPGKKYPLALVIHGGPQAASTTGFNLLGQLLAAEGMVVFQPNYRGSDNLGNAYQRAIFNDAGDGPGRDVMAGLEALERRGFVDETRIGVSGWSYGGYMTSWLIGHYHVWRTAISGAAVNNLFDEYNLSDGNVTVRYGFPGFASPYTGDAGKLYREQSPITFAQAIRTPTLILSDTGDVRVPITQSYQMYHALLANGVPVKFIAYPVGGHFPGDPVRQMDIYRRWTSWLKEYLE